MECRHIQTHTHSDTLVPIHTVSAHTHNTTEDLLGLKNPGVWWVVMAGDRVCCARSDKWSLAASPQKDLRLFFIFSSFFFFLFFFFYNCLTDCFCLLPNIHCLPLFCSVSPQMTSHPWRATSFSFSRSFPPFFHPLCFLPSFCSVRFCHHDKQILNWHGVGLSPMEVHSFIIKSGEARYKLGGTIMWWRIICPWHSRLTLACV